MTVEGRDQIDGVWEGLGLLLLALKVEDGGSEPRNVGGF